MPKREFLGTASPIEREYCPNAYGPQQDQHWEAPSESSGEGDDDLLDLSMIDVEADTEAMRQESEMRLRAQSRELQRFHEKICQRVTARERQNRLRQQQSQKHLDDKCTKVFAATKAMTEPDGRSGRVSSQPNAKVLLNLKKGPLTEYPLGVQIEKMLRSDTQLRDELLLSTVRPRLQDSVDDGKPDEREDEDTGGPSPSPTLCPEQRVALYKTVRQQYMKVGRAKAQNGDTSSSKPRNFGAPKANVHSSIFDAALRSSRVHREKKTGIESIGCQPRSRARGVKTALAASLCALISVDITDGSHVRVHRQAATSATPWRKKSGNPSPATKDGQLHHSEHERFLSALQAQLGTPALCSCGINTTGSSPSGAQPCANNCALYKQPKKREKLLTSVYKQQQQQLLGPTTGASV